MLRQLLSRSPKIRELADDGYRIEVHKNYLVLRDVPYRTKDATIAYADIFDEFALAGEVLSPPGAHTVWYTGDQPYDYDGTPIDIIAGSGENRVNDEIIGRHTLSRKPAPSGTYRDHHHKLSTYAWILAGPAQEIDKTITPQAGRAMSEAPDTDSVFRYVDNATTRAGITEASEKLEIEKVAIIGLGGTGSYILDLLAKVPIKELHLFDGDELKQHNAFRAPGAASIDDINAQRKKVDYFAERYDPMRSGIEAHPYFMNEEHVGELAQMNFVFIAADVGPDKQAVVTYLADHGIDFIDVGMGLQAKNGSVLGQARIAAVTEYNRAMANDQAHVPTEGADQDQDYDRNIQVADMNSLVAALAVIRFKKLRGFYRDLDDDHLTMYTLIDNVLTNEGAS